MPARTLAVLSATVERPDSLSGASRTTEHTDLYKVEIQATTDDGDEGPMLFGYNNSGYAFLETLPDDSPVAAARERIEDYTLDAELVDVEVKPRDAQIESE